MRNFIAAALMSLVFVSAVASAAGPVQKQELLNQKFSSADGSCSVEIADSGFWQAECPLLEKKFGGSSFSGAEIEFFVPYGNPKYQGVEFKGKLPRPLQAFVARDPESPEFIVLGLVYGAPADGMIEPLFAK